MTDQEQKDLDDLLDVESGLTDWEIGFIENLDENWRESDLTSRQAAIFNKLISDHL